MLPPLSTTVAPEIHGSYTSRLSRSDSGASTNKAAKMASDLPHRTARRSKHIYSDRFIPSRVATKLDTGFELSANSPTRRGSNQNHHHNSQTIHTQPVVSAPSSSSEGNNKPIRGGSTRAASSFSMLLKSELLGIHPTNNMSSMSAPSTASASSFVASAYGSPVRTWSDAQSQSSAAPSSALSPTSSSSSSGARSIGSTEVLRPVSSASSNLLRFKAPRQSIHDEVKTSMSLLSSGIGGGSRLRGLYSSSSSLEPEPRRKISRTPFKVLDAPALQDDFYLNLVDWSATNVVAVALGASVFLWSACTSKVTKLCDLSELGGGDSITSVAWSQRGSYLSIGTTSGEVQLWDVTTGKLVRSLGGHVARVGTLAWGSNSPGTTSLLASGSRDRTILLRDPRAPETSVSRLAAHKQEVCGLKWSFDGKQLASGGNDNKLCIWSVSGGRGGVGAGINDLSPSSMAPVARFSEHSAAVKAIAWSPHQHGLLASGGGTADRCIRFWNTQSMTALGAVDTGSQVCNLVWAKTANEVVSTHGYSLNQIIVWKYPSMDKLATLTGHRLRVLYLAMSPDGQTIVTGAGDETLRFWNAFPSAKSSASRWMAGGALGGRAGKLGAEVLMPLGVGGEIR